MEIKLWHEIDNRTGQHRLLGSVVTAWGLTDTLSGGRVHCLRAAELVVGSAMYLATCRLHHCSDREVEWVTDTVVYAEELEVTTEEPILARTFAEWRDSMKVGYWKMLTDVLTWRALTPEQERIWIAQFRPVKAETIRAPKILKATGAPKKYHKHKEYTVKRGTPHRAARGGIQPSKRGESEKASAEAIAALF